MRDDDLVAIATATVSCAANVVRGDAPTSSLASLVKVDDEVVSPGFVLDELLDCLNAVRRRFLEEVALSRVLVLRIGLLLSSVVVEVERRVDVSREAVNDFVVVPASGATLVVTDAARFCFLGTLSKSNNEVCFVLLDRVRLQTDCFVDFGIAIVL